ncbi:MAG TPA: ArsA-related P-loop ATPase [Solirubrobacteraceae bacterium]|nr:ArsA-related P-loop ATPase [Solirubrobacteraceae bacterium]
MGMQALIERRLLFVTGKGGTGRSTIAQALAATASARGGRTLLVELAGARLEGQAAPAQQRAEGARKSARGDPGEHPRAFERALVDPDRTLIDWLAALGGRLPARMLAARASFRFFAAAAPGARELLSLVRILELCSGEGPEAYATVIVDGPASGHALALLRAPGTYAAIARVGPIAARAAEVQALLKDPARSALIAVARPVEMAVTETIELAHGLRRDLGRSLDAVLVNGVLDERFTAAELAALRRLQGPPPLEAAVHAAALARERTVREHHQIARLRKARLCAHELPYLFSNRIGSDELDLLSAALADL